MTSVQLNALAEVLLRQEVQRLKSMLKFVQAVIHSLQANKSYSTLQEELKSLRENTQRLKRQNNSTPYIVFLY